MMQYTRTAHVAWLTFTSVTGICLLVLAWLKTPWVIGVILAWALVVYLALALLITDRFYLADWISASRVVLATAALVVGHFLDYAVLQILLFALAIAADVLDGYVARKQGETQHGAILDMEADQLLVLMLAVVVSSHSILGGLVLLMPALKYLFTLLNQLLKLPLGEPRPVEGDNRRAKFVYVLVLAALFSGLPGLAMPQLSLVCLALALPALAFSFVADLRHQRRAI
jgi:phosphatidylglycerophosphate synthase